MFDPVPPDATRVTILEIRGLRSAATLMSVERELERIDGVHGSVINLTTGRGRVHHDGAPDADAFIAAVSHAGYSARVARSTDARSCVRTADAVAAPDVVETLTVTPPGTAA